MKNILKYTLCFVLVSVLFFRTTAQEYGTGMIFDDEQYRQVQQRANLTRSLYSGIPATHSLKKYTPAVQSQGRYGTCVGWASAYAALTITEAVSENRTDQSQNTREAFSPGFIYTQIKFPYDENCSVGSHIHNALKLMQNKGAAKYTAVNPVNCPDNLNQTLFDQAAENKIEEYAKLFGLYDNDKQKISVTKKSLAENKPVIIGMKTPKSFYAAKKVWEPAEPSVGKYGGHAVCVIGYNDNLHGGVFEIMNSWGPGWGNQGYMYIKYSDYAKFVKYAYQIGALAKKSKKNRLAGSIRLINSEGIEYPVKREGKIFKVLQNIKTESYFRIYIQNNAPAYMYAFGFDRTEKVFPIFPHSPQTAAFLSYSSNEVAIPDEEHFIETDQTEGKNYLCILLSKKPIDTDWLFHQIENSSGSLHQRLEQLLNPRLMPARDISYSNNKAALKAVSNKGSTAFLIMKANHVK